MRWVGAIRVAIELVVLRPSRRRWVTGYGLLVFTGSRRRLSRPAPLPKLPVERYMRVLSLKVTGNCFHIAIGLPSLVPGTKRHRLASRIADSSSLV